MKALEEVTAPDLTVHRPRLSDLPSFLSFACTQLEAPFSVRLVLHSRSHYDDYITKTNQYRSKKSKRNSRRMGPHLATFSAQHSNQKQESAMVAQDNENKEEVVIHAYCDPTGQPVELVFYRCTLVPRLLVKIIGLCMPYHPQLTTITIRWSRLDGFVLYELAKFLPLSHITEICLDDSPVSHCNYFLLLECQSHLKSLRLARCNLVDEDIAAMASRLKYPLPASHTLAILSLESNNITDVGARALAEALRTNRTLRCLNLAGNRITDGGAAYIFGVLIQFPISCDEITLKRRRTLEYLKKKRETYEKCYREVAASSESAPVACSGRISSVSSRTRRTSTGSMISDKSSDVDTFACRAETMTNKLVGAYSDPFDSAEVLVRDEVAYCAGNFSLCYLSMAYNDLDCWSAVLLAKVLAYQAGARRTDTSRGLVRVALEGNRLPEDCDTARVASEWLKRTILQHQPSRKDERAKAKPV